MRYLLGAIGILACLCACAVLDGAEAAPGIAAEQPAAAAPEGSSASAEKIKQARQLGAELRTASSMERRLRVVKELIALGAEGEAAVKGYFDQQLQRVAAAIKPPPSTEAYDKRIEELRKILAELRADANLTKEKTQQIGLPALDELTNVYNRREAIIQSHYQKFSRSAEALRGLVQFLRTLQDKAESDPALQPQSFSLAEYLKEAEKLLEQTQPPMNPQVREILEENEKIARELPPDEVAGMRALNAMRILCGLMPLRIDPKLVAVARGHSQDMAVHGFFAHESPLPGKKTPQDRAKLGGTTASGENIYVGSNVTKDAIRAWFLSPGHHKNMLSESHKRQGLGRYGTHWTQLFGQ